MTRHSESFYTYNFTSEIEGNLTLSIFYLQPGTIQSKIYSDTDFSTYEGTLNVSDINKDWGYDEPPVSQI